MSFIRKEKENGKTRYIHELNCKVCSEDYEVVRGNKSPIKDAWCSKECRKQWYHSTRRISQCNQCGSDFYQRDKTKVFCNSTCYHTHVKENPEKYDLAAKAAKARTHSNTPESIKKMKQTKLTNGDMVDWKDASWKQYWRKCNELTRKVRDVLLEDWDGTDYIDGKYIKDNLTLPHSHGDYPTLDHVVSKTKCYKQGLTPEQACSVENLKWTTRRNNSTKYNK